MSDGEPLGALKALADTLRAAGVSHYDGPVPGWPGLGNVKLVLGPAPEEPAAPSAGTSKAPPFRPLRKVLSEEDIDRGLFGHIERHGEKKEVAG